MSKPRPQVKCSKGDAKCVNLRCPHAVLHTRSPHLCCPRDYCYDRRVKSVECPPKRKPLPSDARCRNCADKAHMGKTLWCFFQNFQTESEGRCPDWRAR